MYNATMKPNQPHLLPSHPIRGLPVRTAGVLCLLALVFLGSTPAPAQDEEVSRRAFVQELTLARNSPNPFNALPIVYLLS